MEYRCYNGAPDFKRSTTDDDDNVFDMVVRNIPASAESGLWISPFRQLPIVRMNIKVGYERNVCAEDSMQESREVYANPPADEFIEDERQININEIKTYRNENGRRGIDGIEFEPEWQHIQILFSGLEEQGQNALG